MRQPKTDSTLGRIGQAVVLAGILSIAVLRLSFTEQPHNALQNPFLWTTARGISLLISAGLVCLITLAFLIQTAANQKAGSNRLFAAGVVLFILGGGIAAAIASDKRAAITEIMTLAVPMAAVIVLRRPLDCPQRIETAVWVILSMGCAAVYVSIDQYTSSNQQVVDAYQKDPLSQLSALGIEPNSLGQFQYEHRLHSKDVRGFLTTSNSTGSFLLAGLCITVGMLTDTLRHRKNDSGAAARSLVYSLIGMAMAAGLAAGQSRGAIASMAAAVCLFALLATCGRTLWKYRILFASLAGLAALGVWGAAIWYGIEHGRLPGPNALYVRWQYWVSAAQMWLDHPLGVGGGNFAIYFPFYKIPAAPETVSNPHNWFLSLLCQFGPAGVVGFVMSILAAVYWGLKSSCGSLPCPVMPNSRAAYDRYFPLLVLMGSVLALLWIRPFVSEGGILGETATIRSSVFVVMYAIPAVCFILPYALLWMSAKDPALPQPRQGLTAGLVCGITGILIHNLIDFALFEPGVWMLFWILSALLAALSYRQPAIHTAQSKTIRCGLALAIAAAFFYWIVWIPVSSGRTFQQGLRYPNKSVDYFTAAAGIDRLDPDGCYYAALSRFQQYESATQKDDALLHQTIAFLDEAAGRDKANYRYAKMRSEAQTLLSQQNPNDAEVFLEAAYRSGLAAQRLYPGNDRIAYDLGKLAEQLHQPQQAVEHYRRAVDIEDAHRKQFGRMYPNYPLWSRLGQSRYAYAKQYIEQHPAAAAAN